MKIRIYTALILMSFIKSSFSIDFAYRALVAGYTNSNNDTGYYIEGKFKAFAFTADFEIRKLSKTNEIYNVFGGIPIPMGNPEYGIFNPSFGIGSEGFVIRVEYLNSFTPNKTWGVQAGYTHYLKDSNFSGIHVGVIRYF